MRTGVILTITQADRDLVKDRIALQKHAWRAQIETAAERDDHWTSALIAKAIGVSVSSIQRICRAHGLQPHRVRQFKLSNDSEFVVKLHDVVGIYVNPLAHAVVLSLEEKSQIQALDRSRPGVPIRTPR